MESENYFQGEESMNKDKEPTMEDWFSGKFVAPNEDFERGELVRGEVVEINEDTVFIDIGTKSEATADISEFADEDGDIAVSVGDEVELRVASITSEGLTLSRGLKLEPQEAKSALQEAYRDSFPVEGVVKGVNKGGFDVEISGIRVFCPISQIDLNYVENPESFIGLKSMFKVMEYGEGGRRIVLSRRAFLEEERQRKIDELWSELSPEDVVNGVVTRIMTYGAFVDIGGIEGLLHVSEISSARVENPSEVLEQGQNIQVKILDMSRDEKGREKLSLSMKALEPDPWERELSFQKEEVVEGKVVSVQSFGVFVELEPGIQGLVHLSELSWEHVRHPSSVVDMGEEVKVRVLDIDRERQRIALSIKQVEDYHRPQESDFKDADDRQSSGKLGTMADLLKDFKPKE